MGRLRFFRGPVRRISAVLLSLAFLTGCSYGHQEPGLFGRSPDPTTVAPPQPAPVSSAAPDAVNPSLPVVGQAVWTSADGLDVQLRIAVHAVRRTVGATVLDWSVTPLPSSQRRAGDPVPSEVKLGLSRYGAADENIFLVDSAAHRVYRPLTTPDDAQEPGCLCTPVGLAEQSLRVGQTRLLQVAYPQLPADLATVDVDISTVPMFWNVPVTPVDRLPEATNPTDLGRPADVTALPDASPVFRFAPTGQKFVISVDAVVASSRFTSVAWTIQSVTSGDGLDSVHQPPFAAAAPAGSGHRPVNAIAASGPQLRLGRGVPESVRLMTAVGAGAGAVECLCTDLRLWATALRSASQQASVVTNLPPLPIGTQQVDVVFPGLFRVAGLTVTSATDATVLSAGPVAARSGTWTYRAEDPAAGWSVDRWPTPLPDSRQLRSYQSTVEQLLR